jgi:hypothetical protein
MTGYVIVKRYKNKTRKNPQTTIAKTVQKFAVFFSGSLSERG